MQSPTPRTNEQILEDSAKKTCEDMKRLMDSELSMVREDFKLYTKANEEAIRRVDIIADNINCNAKSVELIEQSYDEMKAYRDYVDTLELSIESIEQAVHQLDEQTKMIETSFRTAERKLAMHALQK
ncbi:Biogenesis of lysosome-related organelles complex 1 subunit 2 [Entamoeba marina]